MDTIPERIDYLCEKLQPSQPDDIGGVALPERETEIIF
ncbi:hypothetical protein M113_0655 [Bacteroides fragilis str. 3986 N3]|nr:hypothetical protein M111_4446 [Bacteroides fragilis str. 3986T(B)10]EYA53983.1 hypothetical protein M114_0665 [Bacteroides fragilis str. 3986 N(B)22]EYA58783.1 hypothetical protein M112_0661 [Bacteroides fragilis str. 3986 T(B)13]EYE70061.1 hypothetical protein M113_0655 [Bacteroides fragilis str. 3986 N3]